MASFNFLCLPGELRNMIYRFTLTTDPPELEREHKFDCEKCTWDPYQPQYPMFEHGKRIPGCRCWARTGLVLLLANRQIYWEAAPIFWAENHFTFWCFEAFTLCVGTRLRARWRKMLRSVSIIACPGPTTSARFERVLFQCKGLRALETPMGLELGLFRRHATRNRPDVDVAAWADLKRLLPELKTLTRMAWLKPWPRGEVIITRSVDDMRALAPEQLKLAWSSMRVGEYVIHGLYAWAWTNIRPVFPCWMEILEGTGEPDETVFQVRLSEYAVRFTARKLFQPSSPETIARNRLLKAARGKSLLQTKMSVWEGRLRPRHKNTKNIAAPP